MHFETYSDDDVITSWIRFVPSKCTTGLLNWVNLKVNLGFVNEELFEIDSLANPTGSLRDRKSYEVSPCITNILSAFNNSRYLRRWSTIRLSSKCWVNTGN